MLKRLYCLYLISFMLFPCFTQEKNVVYNSDFATGEELFKINKPIDAIPFLEKAISSPDVDPAVYIYLGVAYYQTGAFSDSLSICIQGLTKENTDHKTLAFNAGNSAYAIGNYARADACYAIAMKTDAEFSPAVLNRANAQLKQDHLQDAKDNYELFLKLDPENEQKIQIEELIKLLEAEIARRANEKPELILPEDFVNNEDNILPEYEFEKIAYEMPQSLEEEKVDMSEILPVSETIAPQMRYYEPGDKNLEQLRTSDTAAPDTKYYVPSGNEEYLGDREKAPLLKSYQERKNYGEILSLEQPSQIVSDTEKTSDSAVNSELITGNDYINPGDYEVKDLYNEVETTLFPSVKDN